MNESQISVRYAKALHMSAVEKNEQDKVYEDMQVLEDTCKLDDFQFMLLIPTLQPGQKCKVVGNVFDKHLSKLSMSMT